MRNLKRALSLTLASVMLLGMMVLGTSAASYPDVTDEHDVEAIEVLKAVGVMTGSNSGNFNPDSKVSRIEMAIVMANLLDLDVDYFQGQNQFSDVPEWASGYVNACAASGIVTGVGGGRFGTGNVTATQAALMMLKAIGYFQYNSDFGDNWARATALQASKIRLFNGIDAQDNTQLTRNQVAKLALNALETGMVDADDNTLHITTGEDAGNINITGGKVNYVYRSSRQDFADTINTTEDNAGSLIGVNGSVIELGEQLFNGDLKLVKNDYDDFGRPARTWSYKNDKVGTFAKGSELVKTYTAKVSKGDLYNLLSSTVRSALNGDPSKLTVTVDGYKVTTANTRGALDPATPSNYWERNNSGAIYTPVADSSRKGVVTEVYVDKDNNVDIVIYNTYVFKATSDYNASRDDVKMAVAGDTAVSLNAGQTTLYGEDFDIENIKTDDYLLVTVAAGDVQSVEVANKVEGEVTGWVVDDSVTIGETTYSYSATTLKTSGGVRTTVYTVGQPAIVVLDKYDNIIAVDEAVASSNFVFIKQFGSTSGLNTEVRASAYFTDGTKAEVAIASVAGEKRAGEIMKLGSNNNGNRDIYTWYTYSMNSDGKYVLYNVPTRFGVGTQTATATTADGTAKMIFNGRVDFLAGTDKTGALANDKTILVMVDKAGDIQAYTGTKSIPDVTPASGATAGDFKVYYLQDTTKSYVEYAFTDVENKGVDIVDGSENTSFLFVLKYDGDHRAPNATTYYTYKVVDPETFEEKTEKFDTNSVVTDDGEGNVFELFYKPRYNPDGEITRLSDVATATGKYFSDTMTDGAAVYSNGSLTFKKTDGTYTADQYVISGDSKIVLVTRDKRLMKDKANSYEIRELPAQTLEGDMKDKTFTGTIAGCFTSADSRVVDTMYVYIAPQGTGGSSTGPSGDPAVSGNVKAILNDDDLEITFIVAGKDSATLSEKIAAICAARNVTSDKVGHPTATTWTVPVDGVTMTYTEQAIVEQGGIPNNKEVWNQAKSAWDTAKAAADADPTDATKAETARTAKELVDLADSGVMSGSAVVTPTDATHAVISGLKWTAGLDVQVDGYGKYFGKTLKQMYGTEATPGSDAADRAKVSAATHWAIVAINYDNNSDCLIYFLIYNNATKTISTVKRNSGTGIVTVTDVTNLAPLTVNSGSINYTFVAP